MNAASHFTLFAVVNGKTIVTSTVVSVRGFGASERKTLTTALKTAKACSPSASKLFLALTSGKKQPAFRVADYTV